MPSAKTTAETTRSIRIPIALHSELEALAATIRAEGTTALAPPTAAHVLLAAVRSGLPAVRSAYGLTEPGAGKRAKKG